MSIRAMEFRKLLNAPGVIMAAGVYECLTAKVVEKAGFSAAHLTGHGLSVSVLGLTDFGFTTMAEVVSRARDICNAISIPVIVDIDTGYGNALNVQRTIRECEAAGAAAVHIEDQTWPKKCGHMEGKKLISQAEMVSKIRAAVDARQNADFTIIARTDARAVEGMDAAIERSKAYAEAGADGILIDGLESMDDLRRAGKEVSVPLMANMTEGGKTPYLSAGELEDMGYKIVIYPLALMWAALKVMRDVASEIKATGTLSQGTRQSMVTFMEFNDFMGVPELFELERKYAVGD